MPIHEYACAQCGKSFEELIIRKSDEGDVRCPQCGNRRVTRRMSAPAAARSGSSGGASRPPRGCGPVG